MRRIGGGLARLWLVPIVAVIWELGARGAESMWFPPPSTILSSLHQLWFSGPASGLFLTDEFHANVMPSLIRLAGGWIAAGLIGIVLGVVLGRSARLSDYIDPLLQFCRAIPPPMLLGVFLALFSIGTQMQLATIVFGIVWPVLLNTVDGARDIDRLHLETATVFKLTGRQRLFKIILPGAAPKIFAGLRLSLSLALILMVISEFVGSTNGIGFTLQQAQNVLNMPTMWACFLLLGVLGLALNGALLGVERRVLAWHHSERQRA